MDETAALSCVPTTTYDGTRLCVWRNQASTRGTLDVLWLCASTLVLCVWNAVHPDVPSPGTSWWRTFRNRMGWLVIALFAPEVLVLKALAQFCRAYVLLVRVTRETRVPTKFPWWMRFIEHLRQTPLTENELLRRDEVPSLPPTPGATSTSLELVDMTEALPAHITRTSLPGTSPEPGSDARKHPWTLTHSFYAVMHGFVTSDGGDAFWSTIEPQSGHTVTFFDVQKGIQHITAPSHDAARIPDLSADDLDDRGKAGAVVKTLLAWQLFVFIANCVVRLKQGLPLSLLEIKTLAHCVCSLIALALWWYKPHSVDVAIGADRTRSLPPSPKPANWDSLDREFPQFIAAADSSGVLFIATVLAIMLVYGLPHLFARNAHFPSFTEHFLWVISSSMMILFPLVGCFSTICSCGEEAYLSAFLVPTVSVPYLVGALYLVGESVRQVFALPVGSFSQPHLTRFILGF